MSETLPDDLAVLSFSVELAREAGAIIRPVFHAKENGITRDGSSVEFKGAVDLVTETDKQVEDLVATRIRERFPTHRFLGEETTKNNDYQFQDAPTWIVDPIDGTTNFVHRNPFFCVSIAFAVNKQVRVGVVYSPITDDLFTAVRGQGCRHNGTRCAVSPRARDVTEAVVSTNVGYDRSPPGVQFTTSHMAALLTAGVRGLNLSGSAAMQLAYVAAGRFDAFYETGIHPWDIAAACLLVEEAGGVCLDPLNGANLDLTVRRVIGCSNESLAKQLISLFPKQQCFGRGK